MGASWSQPEAAVLLLCPNVDELRHVEVWRRLLATAEHQLPVNVCFYSVEPAELEVLFPPSVSHSVVLLESWPEACPSDILTSVVIKSGEAVGAMLGAPTEEAWDLFQDWMA